MDRKLKGVDCVETVYRIFVEKKEAYAVAAAGVREDLLSALNIRVEELHLLNRYDLEGIAPEAFERAARTILSEPPVDETYGACPYGEGYRVFAVEYLPGQFDQRADSCAQCIQLVAEGARPLVRTARVYAVKGVSEADFERIKRHLINPVECREAALEKPATLKVSYDIPTRVETLDGFTALDASGLRRFLGAYALAMDFDDIAFCQRYFRDEERRDPTLTEIRMIDTYWSDHCRHTTFLTELERVDIAHPQARRTWEKYRAIREKLYGADTKKPVTLMDLAVIGAKELKAEGKLGDLDESEEINACSVKIEVDVDGRPEEWLLMFKNETHNHPTEIEPFGGAATCLGGAIRDPLSGRSYVYQAMRVTGAGDPLAPAGETRPGKLPQRMIVTTAANGYSSYGNQIGLATGLVREIYHPGYVAKRLEIGAVIGAAPAKNVVREEPVPGDIVLLLGGRTGRDGCGGATGSSKAHTLSSLETCGSEVQKGNPPEERKLQRLMRDPAASRLIKRCNDFGAGGVSVAIGELSDGLDIDLNAVPQKYEGLDGTELAISESQERMAVVVAPQNEAAFIALAQGENLLAVRVAVVTGDRRLRMRWNGSTIVDLSREFLGSNGASKRAAVSIPARAPATKAAPVGKTLGEALVAHMSDLNRCSQKGLCERFDSTIGAGTVLMPFGGKCQLTPAQAMAAKIPVPRGETTTCSLMAYGYDPYLTGQDPYRGAMLAVIESVAKLVAAGGTHEKCWLTFQEYFPRTKDDPERWGLPAAALLGALEAQLSLGCAAIGGKDSMSGSFEEIDVPPTLVSFAVCTARTHNIVSPEFKGAGNRVYLLVPRGEAGPAGFEEIKANFSRMRALIADGTAHSVWAVTAGGALEGICQMALGNRIGFSALESVTLEGLLEPAIGAFLFESESLVPDALQIGVTLPEYEFILGGETVALDRVQEAYEEKLAPVYPYRAPAFSEKPAAFVYDSGRCFAPRAGTEKPLAVIPVFPGTNCEYDSARAFERAGAAVETVVVRNLTAESVEDSVRRMAGALARCQILMLPGGFSGGDEPEGSAKFIAAFLRNPRLREQVERLLEDRDGLILGICNGFQALIKLGLLPFGRICDIDAACPTLTYNAIGRHQSMLVRTRVCTPRSPWLQKCRAGDIHTLAVSHGEGRFIAGEDVLRRLAENGQIATQYVDFEGNPSMDIRFNPNGSYQAIEGITSPDGRVFGKMGHSERCGADLYRNVAGLKDQHLFESAVEYFRI